jgi:hypothetical protein
MPFTEALFRSNRRPARELAGGDRAPLVRHNWPGPAGGGLPLVLVRNLPSLVAIVVVVGPILLWPVEVFAESLPFASVFQDRIFVPPRTIP